MMSVTSPNWAVTGAALLSFAAFLLGDGPSPVMFVLALCLLAVYGVPFRVERATRASWLWRLALLGLALLLNASHDPQLQDSLISASGMNFLGPLLAAELVLRAWYRPVSARPMILLSGILLLFGCVTADQRVGLFLVPPYFLCVILALRADRRRAAEPEGDTRMSSRNVAIVLAIGLGAIAQWGFRVYKSEIIAWGSRSMGVHFRLASGAQASGIVKDPKLGPTFGSPGASTRILRIVGALPDPHLHGMAYDTYSHGAWLPTLRGRHFEPVTSASLDTSTKGQSVRITRFVDDDGMVSAPLGAASIELAEDAETTWSRDLGGPIRHETLDSLAYTVVIGSGDDYQGPLCVPPTPTERARCLVVPGEIDPSVRALAARIVGQSIGAREKIAAVRDYLLQNNAYSLRTDPGRGDPVSNFLLGHKAAHCEFFASSAAILLRCVGVPTRYAIGYYAHESDGSDATVVRGQDAHAWAESWVDGTGWVVVEATPGNGRPDRTAHTPFWWKIQDHWQNMILTLRSGLSHLTGPRLIFILLCLIVLLMIPSAFRLAWERQSAPSTFAYTAAPLDLAELAPRFDAWLAKRGVPCPPERPWEEHLAIPAIQGLLAPTREQEAIVPGAKEFVSAYNHARFSGMDDPQAVAEIAELLRRLEHYT